MNSKPKILLFSILILTFAASVFAQETVPPEDAAKFIGQQKTVCGKVASAHYATRSKGQPTFLNLNKPYPYPIFTVLIWRSDRSKFEKPPEALSGKEIYPIKIQSEDDLIKEVAGIATLSMKLGYQLETENRPLTKEEAYIQLGHSASLFKAILLYVR